jgi:hypothetical protein
LNVLTRRFTRTSIACSFLVCLSGCGVSFTPTAAAARDPSVSPMASSARARELRWYLHGHTFVVVLAPEVCAAMGQPENCPLSAKARYPRDDIPPAALLDISFAGNVSDVLTNGGAEVGAVGDLMLLPTIEVGSLSQSPDQWIAQLHGTLLISVRGTVVDRFKSTRDEVVGPMTTYEEEVVQLEQGMRMLADELVDRLLASGRPHLADPSPRPWRRDHFGVSFITLPAAQPSGLFTQ